VGVLLIHEEGLLEVGVLLEPIFGLLEVRLDLEDVFVIEDVLPRLAQRRMPVKAHAHILYRIGPQSQLLFGQLANGVKAAEVSAGHKLEDPFGLRLHGV
jgi:hypothetical protein